ncbi:MOSC domain-containing protein [Eudoraea sp.]|uniref:MOSC domain-containing protein n=1 Tax=Eudoraea sp. TaxID=1979955 RepID=UPI003C740AC7
MLNDMQIGVIESLWRFPVKSFQGEKLEQVEFDRYGILGDRAYALIDKETGKVVSAKSVKLYPDLLFCHAVYTQEPRAGEEIPSVRITLANGTSVDSDSEDIDQILSDYFKRAVMLARVAPDDFTIDQYHPDLGNLDPAGNRNISTEQKLGSALFQSMGVDSPLPPGSFMDVSPVSLVTSSSLNHLHELQPKTNFDVKRFRMNVVVKTTETGFIENTWVGKTLTIENNVSIVITKPDPRCVMTTLPQKGMPKDNNVLRTLVEHNRLDIMGSGKFPCAGVYALVGSPGVVKVNDKVELS